MRTIANIARIATRTISGVDMIPPLPALHLRHISCQGLIPSPTKTAAAPAVTGIAAAKSPFRHAPSLAPLHKIFLTLSQQQAFVKDATIPDRQKHECDSQRVASTFCIMHYMWNVERPFGFLRPSVFLFAHVPNFISIEIHQLLHGCIGDALGY